MDEGTQDVLLLSTYDNGCSPRITNIGFYNRSDSVVSFRNGHSLPAEIKENMGSHLHDNRYIEFSDNTLRELCLSTKQYVDIEVLKDRYMANIMDWYNMVRAGDDAPTIPCQIPENSPGEWSTLRIGKMSAENYDGTCDVVMEPRSETEHKFTVRFKDCNLQHIEKNHEVFNGSFSMDFTCLGISEDNSLDHACVFTKTQPNKIIQHDYISWVVGGYQGKVFLYYVGTCARNTRLDIVTDEKRRHPIATFTFLRYSNSSSNFGLELYTVCVSVMTYIIILLY